VVGGGTRRKEASEKMAILEFGQTIWALGGCAPVLWMAEINVATIICRSLLIFGLWTALAVRAMK
jgi:hypothetical protein